MNQYRIVLCSFRASRRSQTSSFVLFPGLENVSVVGDNDDEESSLYMSRNF